MLVPLVHRSKSHWKAYPDPTGKMGLFSSLILLVILVGICQYKVPPLVRLQLKQKLQIVVPLVVFWVEAFALLLLCKLLPLQRSCNFIFDEVDLNMPLFDLIVELLEVGMQVSHLSITLVILGPRLGLPSLLLLIHSKVKQNLYFLVLCRGEEWVNGVFCWSSTRNWSSVFPVLCLEFPSNFCFKLNKSSKFKGSFFFSHSMPSWERLLFKLGFLVSIARSLKHRVEFINAVQKITQSSNLLMKS